MRVRRVAAMAHPTFVNGAVQRLHCILRARISWRRDISALDVADGACLLGRHRGKFLRAGAHGHGTPSAPATSTALRMPSSWNPQPQYAPANQVRRTPWISALRVCAATEAGE